MAYAIQGYSFEEYLQSQNIPEPHLAEAAIYFQDTIETHKRAVAAGGAVASDQRLVAWARSIASRRVRCRSKQPWS